MRFAPALLLAVALPAFAAEHAAPAALTPLSTVLADIPQAALDAKLVGDVVVSARVTALGLVDSVRAVSGDKRLRESALDAVRWYVYPPQSRPTWTTATVRFDGSIEVYPLPFDVRGMAIDAENAGHLPAAMDAWTGVLNRTGKHPTMRNPWAVRAHIAQLQRRLPARPAIRGQSVETALTARVEQQRTTSTLSHAELVVKFDDAMKDMAWWTELYQWEAASLLGCGRSMDAMRSLLVFRAGARDTASWALADRALKGIAAGDTVVVGEMLKHEGRQFDSPGD